MKNVNLFGIIIVSIGLLAVSSGCHRHPVVTPIPDLPGPSAQPPGLTGVPQGSGLGNGNDVSGSNLTPVGLSEDAKQIMDGPHNEDREMFRADTVYFDLDQATIKTSEESKLQDIASNLKGKNAFVLVVEGNCDERGTEKYNLSLGERRALSIREYLANLGVDPMRIMTKTYGASKPVDPGHNESAWKKNRRGDFVFVTRK